MFLKDTQGRRQGRHCACASCTASTRPTRTTPPTASCSIRAARSTSRKARSITRRSRRPTARRSAASTPASSATSRGRRSSSVYVTYGFANPHGHVFDRWGQDIVVDGTGANPYHAALFSGLPAVSAAARRPPQVYQQPTRPCPGMEILSSRHFPEDIRAICWSPTSSASRASCAYKLDDKGASFAGTEVEPILSSTDPNFRPSDLQDRAGRGPLLPRLAQPDHRPHAAQSARSQPRPRTWPDLPRHLRRPAAAEVAEDRTASRSRSCSICSRSRKTAFATAPASS